MKRCAKCGVTKFTSDFTISRSRKDGLNPSCKECHRQYTRTHYENNKRYYKSKARDHQRKTTDLVRQLKDGKACTDCKVSYPYYVMDFDHIRGRKVNDVARMVNTGASKEAILLELEKCDLVCANCHRERTYGKRKTAPVV